MREIKFRAWDVVESKFVDKVFLGSMMYEVVVNATTDVQNVDNFIVGQFTGLHDKNGITDIYEGDIIDMSGNVKGNIYETTPVDTTLSDLVVQGFGTGEWIATYKSAVARGCKDAERDASKDVVR